MHLILFVPLEVFEAAWAVWQQYGIPYQLESLSDAGLKNLVLKSSLYKASLTLAPVTPGLACGPWLAYEEETVLKKLAQDAAVA